MSLIEIQQIVADYFKTQPILKAWIFGSYARGEESPLSDVDVLVEYEPEGISLLKHATIICDLEKLLDKPIDLVQMKLLRPNVKERVIDDLKLIYERSC
ncbi:MAG: nucleotidyltransferase domain-containing protein [Muribaculaceae bacterium]|nr:nucleotidyltransferase domain-containing protein [Muribaculaceae bacterium]